MLAEVTSLFTLLVLDTLLCAAALELFFATLHSYIRQGAF